ncbi:MAG: glycosyltransferase family protein, partial [Patescibacteria group bacterium]|nr:glycosyltransferase family protein [Patescibacteria group bacterium]
MVKIVYGVAGEGSGHSSRAREMAGHLRDAGHAVRLASYDRGYRNLKDDFDVLEIEGLCIASGDNRVSVVKTFTENLKRLPEGYRALQQLRRTLFKEFQPDCVITDFEPMTAYLANHYALPLITIDNQHRMRYVEYQSPPALMIDAQVTKNIIRAMVPRPDVSLVTAFRGGRTTNDRTFVFPPIVRRAVLDRQPSRGEHILVYLTSGYETFVELLGQFGRERFVVYGYDRSDSVGNLVYRCPSRDGFLDDLVSAKAVMATAGFTLISEALHLRKPYLAMPMRGQFEQELNAYQLEQAGYGKR